MTNTNARLAEGMSVKQMAHRCPDARIAGQAVLEGWELLFKGCATIEPNKEKNTPVLVWEISEEDEKRLDVYEGYPHYYRKDRRVAELEAPKARAHGIALVVAPGDDASVPGDAQLLEQALVNLVENAFRYSGGDRVELACRVRDGRAELSVADNGVGIAARHLPRLFERFYRVDKARSRALGGTGLGLAIVKHVAQVHGGDASVSSDPGVRTEFRLSLPLGRR